MLLVAGDHGGALDLFAPVLGSPDPPVEAMTLAARALRGLGRHAEAAEWLTSVAAAKPDDPVVAHNLAAALGDAGDHDGSTIAARRAVALGDAPESWLVLGNALQAAGDLQDARAAFARAVQRRPAYLEALRTLSQLIWMMEADPEAALFPLRRALRTSPSPALAALTCGVIQDISGPADAYAFIERWTDGESATVELAAASAASWLDVNRQFRHAGAAATLAPHLGEARHAWAAAQLARGQIEAALADLGRRLEDAPRDQVALALQRTAWRMARRSRALDDAAYRGLVRAYDLEPPSAWPSREAWLAELATALRELHAFCAGPFGQSIRAGGQSRTDPRWVDAPVVVDTFAAFADPIADYVARMQPSEPMGAVGAQAAAIAGAWSVSLKAGGRHSDHVHPRGWISSAFYVDVPEPAASNPRGGWLRFGATHLGPGIDLPAEHWVEPRPGRLVLFPSYLWHGTEPFQGDGERLTLAFDAQPAAN